MADSKVKVEVVQGVEGHCLYIDEVRVAGPKPWGGGRTVYAFDVDRDDLFSAIRVPCPTCRDAEHPGYAVNCTPADRERGDLWACGRCGGDAEVPLAELVT